MDVVGPPRAAQKRADIAQVDKHFPTKQTAQLVEAGVGFAPPWAVETEDQSGFPVRRIEQ